MGRFLSIYLFALLACLNIPTADAAESAGANSPTVLITGANRGLGFEFARQYSAAGWNVIATARNPAGAEDLQALAAEFPGITIEQLDVLDLDMIDALAEKYADQPIDVLLNNAGISGTPSPEQVFRKLNYELFDDYMRTNARGPLKMAEAFLKQVQTSEQKKIVVVSSKAGLFSEFSAGTKGTYFYRTSKAAVNMLMLQVAQDVKRRGIAVVILNPGLVDTQHQLAELNEKLNLGLTLVPIEDSIAGMRQVISEKGLEESGNLYQWNGKQLDF
jgi:NAD(P)-dependent dehydrogenase (short-subunit alcohol dehydrogenase family)